MIFRGWTSTFTDDRQSVFWPASGRHVGTPEPVMLPSTPELSRYVKPSRPSSGSTYTSTIRSDGEGVGSAWDNPQTAPPLLTTTQVDDWLAESVSNLKAAWNTPNGVPIYPVPTSQTWPPPQSGDDQEIPLTLVQQFAPGCLTAPVSAVQGWLKGVLAIVRGRG